VSDLNKRLSSSVNLNESLKSNSEKAAEERSKNEAARKRAEVENEAAHKQAESDACVPAPAENDARRLGRHPFCF